jgi:hypothetical protein
MLFDVIHHVSPDDPLKAGLYAKVQSTLGQSEKTDMESIKMPEKSLLHRSKPVIVPAQKNHRA